jgi:hypothetical protein
MYIAKANQSVNRTLERLTAVRGKFIGGAGYFQRYISEQKFGFKGISGEN